jgi:pilus assembly protein CpaE
VLGPKGGTGKTLTACNLAAGLAIAGTSVIVVDLDLQFGDVGLALGLRPERTLYELATAGGTIDAEKVADFLIEHPSGVRALLAPRRPDHAGGITVEFVRSLFDTLRQMADFVVVDTPPGFTPEVIAAIDRSSSVCVVAMLDALSLKNSKLALETLDLMGYDRGRVKIVLNRADSRVGVTAEDVTDLLGHAPDVRVPSHRDITRSVNEAVPIVLSGGNAEAKRAFQSLAASYIDPANSPRGAAKESVAKHGQRRRRLLRRRKGAN